MDRMSYESEGLRRSGWSVGCASEFGEEFAAEDAATAGGTMDWDAIVASWEEEWHGALPVGTNAFTTSSGHSSPESCDVYSMLPSPHPGHTQAPKQVFATKEAPGGRVWSKVKSWVRQAKDKQRGIAYTKKGPCQLFEDWPIPAYPEDYDWDEDYQ